MTKTLTLFSIALMAAAQATTALAATGNAEFDALAKSATEKHQDAMKDGYAWTSAAINRKFNPQTDDGKAYKESGRKITLVDVALYEGEKALKAGDTAKAMQFAKQADGLADAQLQQREISSDYKILWK